MKIAQRIAHISTLLFVTCLFIGCGDSTEDTSSVTSPTTPGFSQPIGPQAQPSLESMPPEIQALIEEGQETQAKLQELSAKLSTIQEQALSIEKIVALRESLEDAAEAAILKEAPDAKATLERLPELVAILEKNPEIAAGNPAAFSEETNQLIQEYETLTAKIQPLQAKAAALPEIEAARKELFDTLHDESLKIDPEFETMEKEYDALTLQLQEMEQAFMAAQQQAQAQQGVPPTPGISTPIATPPPTSEAAETITE